MRATDCEHQAQGTGGGKGNCEAPALTWVNTLLGNVKGAINGTYHACEARYVERCLAGLACRFNRRYKLADPVPGLVYAAVRTAPLSNRP